MKKEDILFDVVSDLTEYKKEDLLKQDRSRRLSDLRRIIAYILRDKINLGVQEAGPLIYRNHSSITYLVKSHHLLMETDEDYQNLYNLIHSEWYYRVYQVNYNPSIDEHIDVMVKELERMREEVLKIRRIINEKYKMI